MQGVRDMQVRSLVGQVTLGCYRECFWWHTMHMWAINDVALALPSDNNTVPGAQHTEQVHTTLHQAHMARVNVDYAHAALLNRDI